MQQTSSFLTYVFMLASLLASPSHAASTWELAASSPQAKVFIDRQTIEIDGNSRRVLQLQEFATRTEMGFKSVVGHTEYDCATRQVRLLDFVSYEGSMGAGEQVARLRSPQPWAKVQTKSIFGLTLKSLCSAKQR